MTAAVARIATEHDHRLLPAYLEHVTALGLSDRALRDRLRAARALLAEAPELPAWQALPISERLAALKRTAPGRWWCSPSAPAGCVWTWS